MQIALAAFWSLSRMVLIILSPDAATRVASL
jgi:hypothetical protein